MEKVGRIGNWYFHISTHWRGVSTAYWGLLPKDDSPSYMKQRIWIRVGWLALDIRLKGFTEYDSTNWPDDND